VPDEPQGQSSIDSTSDSSRWGYSAKIFVTLGCFAYVIGFIASAWSTGNPLFILGAIGSAFIGLLTVPLIHNWFIKVGERADQHAGTLMKGIERGAAKVWGLRSIILVFIIFGIVIGGYTPVPSMIQNRINDSQCTQNQTPMFFCGNGIYVTPMQVDEGKNNQHVISNINIGIIDNKDKGPFNQYDANNNGAEKELEDKIFKENHDCTRSSYVTLIVATVLSQTVADAGLSSNVGLDNLRGAYMAQYNFNRDPAQHSCLRLLIANFGTKGVAEQTIPVLMRQIKLYAYSDTQHFMGVIGFPFSGSVTQALYARTSIPGSTEIPLISPSAVADSFTYNHDITPPPNFYTNFYRVVPPVSVESKVISHFINNYLPQTQAQTVLFEDPTDQYSKSLGDAVYKNFSGDIKEKVYTEGQPDTLKDGIDYVIANQCQQPPCNPIQIFFAGYADDVNTLKNKLNAARERGDLKQPSVRIIGGGGLYDLGTYSMGNYANLFFTLNASYARINPRSHSDGIPIPPQQPCPKQLQYNEAFNCEFYHFFHQVYPTSIYGSELAGTHVLLMYDGIQAFLNVWTHANKETNTSLWQAITRHWSDVKFQGVTGKIQFTQSSNTSPNNPVNKPKYVACTDGSGHTHVVAEYDIDNDQLQPIIDNTELDICLNGS
jgi:hypothetical protein